MMNVIYVGAPAEHVVTGGERRISAVVGYPYLADARVGIGGEPRRVCQCRRHQYDIDAAVVARLLDHPGIVWS